MIKTKFSRTDGLPYFLIHGVPHTHLLVIVINDKNENTESLVNYGLTVVMFGELICCMVEQV